MSFIVPLIVTVAALVALGSAAFNILLAAKGLSHFGRTLSQAKRRSRITAAGYSHLKHRPKALRQSPDAPFDDPLFSDDQALDRLAQYLDRP